MGMIQSVSGARGRVGEDFTAEACFKLAAAFGNFLPKGPVLIGRDSRPSGKTARQSVAAGLLLTGHQVVDLGLVPTPAVGFAVPVLKARGAVVITASHNPAEWNGLKFLDDRGLYLGPESLRSVYAPDRTTDPAGRGSGDESVPADILNDYLDAVVEQVDLRLLKKRRLKVVVDAVNGAAGYPAARLLERLGAEFFLLNGEPTGLFTHPPEPRPEHLGQLAEEVRRREADLGLALDPDGDRLALISESGIPLSEELTLAFCVEAVLEKKPGGVVTNLSTSQMVEEIAARFAVPFERTPVGEFFVARRMLELDAVIGGEGNGGVILPACHPGRDGLVAAALLLELLARRNEPVSRLAARLDRFCLLKERVEIVGGRPPEPDRLKLDALFNGIQPDTRDGLRYSGPGWWCHIRVSNTEPIVRILAEAGDRSAAARIVEGVRTILRS
ncbi:MAG TPA: phosphoglucosamine mutase [bacterium]|nr:phosphoglucosamine mutase [bacterium]